MDSNTKTGSSLLTTLLLVLFIALKLMGYIDWSWWWVLSPAWIPFALVVVVGGIALVVIALTQNKGARR